MSWVWFTTIWMPGKSYKGLMPPLTKQESALTTALQQDAGLQKVVAFAQ